MFLCSFFCFYPWWSTYFSAFFSYFDTHSMDLYLCTANNLHKLLVQNLILYLHAFNTHSVTVWSKPMCSTRLRDLIIYISLAQGVWWVVEVEHCRPDRHIFFLFRFGLAFYYFIYLKFSAIFKEKWKVNLFNLWWKGCVTKGLNHGVRVKLDMGCPPQRHIESPWGHCSQGGLSYS